MPVEDHEFPPHDECAHLLVGDEADAEHDLDLATFYSEVESDEFDLVLDLPKTGAWYPAPCIEALQRDLDSAFPGRTKPDWIIGDPAHSSRVSDHNPDEGGMVHAIDIRLGGDLDPQRVLEATIGDPRAWYVIHNGVIYSRTYDWAPRTYTGANPHETHIHLSVRYTHTAEQDTTEWGPLKVKTPTVDLSVVRRQFKIAQGLVEGKVSRKVSVRRVQLALNAKTRAALVTDGVVGRKTIAAYAEWEKREKVPGLGRETVPDRKSLPRLVQPKWKVS